MWAAHCEYSSIAHQQSGQTITRKASIGTYFDSYWEVVIDFYLVAS